MVFDECNVIGEHLLDGDAIGRFGTEPYAR